MARIVKDAAEKIRAGTYPPLSEIMQQALSAGVKICICEQSARPPGMDDPDFIEEEEVVGAVDCNDLAVVTF
ncbi:MAG: uncharacterized protein PWR25_1722 [Euryarchaeota archaeon]|jgi:predicted peroxiredoxin|nr:uncharacterized protein [Euryarchaeota archaeon]